MAGIVIKISDQMSHQDLNRLRTQIVKNLTQQGIPVITSYTDMYYNEPEPRQTDMTTPGVSATTPNVSGAT
jgi:septin family protein